MRKIIFVMVVLSLGTTCLNAQTAWMDGQDLSLNYDRGRGVSNWQEHYDLGAKGDANMAAGYIRDRAANLKSQLSRASYSRLYADITYLIASYGIKSAGWLNGSDSRAPSDDPNRALLNWEAHQNYVLSYPGGYETASKLFFDRLTALKGILSKEEYARCYADCSILLLNFSRMK
ncbi:MAG: hypothetical protein IPP71_19920 [Bacteroidetes bacterium]|nr:hypothetical protein [Bacteroidota bacterium]